MNLHHNSSGIWFPSRDPSYPWANTPPLTIRLHQNHAFLPLVPYPTDNSRFIILTTWNLSACGPDVLQESIPLSQSVEAVVTLGSRSDEAAESICLDLSGGSTTLIDLGDWDLDTGVVLGFDDAVGGTALAWDVARRKDCVSSSMYLETARVFNCGCDCRWRLTSVARSYSSCTTKAQSEVDV